MQRAEMLQQIQDIVRDVTGAPEAIVSEHTILEDLSDWDSVVQAQMIVAVERHFDILFDIDELSSLPDAGTLMDIVEEKLARRPSRGALVGT